jgi:hypothetical protein
MPTDTKPAPLRSEPNLAPVVPATSQTVLTPATSQETVAAQPASSEPEEQEDPGSLAAGGWLPRKAEITAVVVAVGGVAALVMLRRKQTIRTAARRGGR